MKNRVIILMFAITLSGTTSFSQTLKERIDKQIKDPKTAENSAKADVYIQKKKLIDSVVNKGNDQQLLSKKKNKRKKHCKKDSNN